MQARSQPQNGRWMSYLLVSFVLLTCVRVWTGPAPVLQTAHAQIPDSGTQRHQLLEQARQTNQLLAQIKEILEKQTLNVRVLGADNQATAPGKPARARP